jgi:hypothetical protein
LNTATAAVATPASAKQSTAAARSAFLESPGLPGSFLPDRLRNANGRVLTHNLQSVMSSLPGGDGPFVVRLSVSYQTLIFGDREVVRQSVPDGSSGRTSPGGQYSFLMLK